MTFITVVLVVFFAPFQNYKRARCVHERVQTERSTMADLDQLLSSVQSDFQLFGDLFGNFELHMPDFSDEESAENPEADIKQLLALPSTETINAATPAPVESSDGSELKDQTDRIITPIKQEETEKVQQSVSEQSAAQNVHEINKAESHQSVSVKSDQDKQTSRFKALTAAELDNIKENKYAPKTKSNTKWGVNLLQG